MSISELKDRILRSDDNVKVEIGKSDGVEVLMDGLDILLFRNSLDIVTESILPYPLDP